MKTIAILQARMSSTRLPGKVLALIKNRPMLEFMLERVQHAELIDQVVVATSTDNSDDVLEDFCNHLKIKCYRGSLNNVLQRFENAVNKYGGDYVVRLTGDCPLIDPRVIDATIQFFLNGGYDYASNTMPPTFPDGLDVEVFSKQALERSYKMAKTASELEHVTLYMRNHPEEFRLGGFLGMQDFSKLRWTVDEPEDLVLVRAIFNALYEERITFGYQDVIDFLKKNKNLSQINSKFSRNEGMKKTNKKDSNE